MCTLWLGMAKPLIDELKKVNLGCHDMFESKPVLTSDLVLLSIVNLSNGLITNKCPLQHVFFEPIMKTNKSLWVSW